MALVTAERCPTCKQPRGERHKVVASRPADEMLQEWAASGQAEATDGCPCLPRGMCRHGHYSWLVSVGMVQKDPNAWQPGTAKKAVQRQTDRGKGQSRDVKSGPEGRQMKVRTKVAKPAKERSTQVGGRYRSTSAIGVVFTALSNQRSHNKSELKKLLSDKSIDLDYRIACIRRDGLRYGKWKVEDLDEGRVRLMLTKKGTSVTTKAGSSQSVAKKPAAPPSKPAAVPKKSGVQVQEE